MKNKFIISFICAFLAFAGFYTYAEITKATNPFAEILGIEDERGTDENKNVPSTQEKEVEIPKTPRKEISGELFFVVMGVDGDDVKNIAEVKGQRTDTMILTKLNFDNGEIVMMNLPRDTMVKIPNHGVQKLNAGHALGGNQGAMDAIRALSNLDLTKYVKVDYEAIRNLVDSIGGVEFNVPVDMKYYDPSAKPPLDINLKAGLQTINGDNAIKLLRWRHNSDWTTGGYGNGSDISRIETQQNFIKAVIKQALTFKNIFKLPSILQKVLPNVDTNIELEKMISAAASAGKLNSENVVTEKLPGEAKYVDGISFWVHDKQASENLFKSLFGNYYLGD